MQKAIYLLFFILFPSVTYANFPITAEVDIYKLEVWPSNNGTGRYGAYVTNALTAAGCANNTVFAIKDGPGAEAAYSTLLAAMMAGKRVEVYITECSYGPVVDRVRVLRD